MKNKKVVVFNDKIKPTLAKTVVVKYSMPSYKEFSKLFKSVDWERSFERVAKNKKHTTFAVSLYIDNSIIGMGRVVGDGSYFTIYDVVVEKSLQGLGFGTIILNEIVDWYKSIKDDDTFLYLNASKGCEAFYEKFGFRSRPNEDVGSGMKWYDN